MRILRIGRVETAVPGSIRIAVFCALAPPVSAAQYPVDQRSANASDAIPGGEPAPWKTVARAAAAKELRPGDVERQRDRVYAARGKLDLEHVTVLDNLLLQNTTTAENHTRGSELALSMGCAEYGPHTRTNMSVHSDYNVYGNRTGTPTMRHSWNVDVGSSILNRP